MQELTSRERIRRILNREPVDRVGIFEWFWPDTHTHWIDQGKIPADMTWPGLWDHFGVDIREVWPFNMVADLDHGDVIVEEDEETKLVRNGNGALLKWWKEKSGTPEHVDFFVKDRTNWEEHMRPKLVDDSVYRRRIDFDKWREMRVHCDETDTFMVWNGVNVFENMHPMCGHENMLMGMALDPDWVRDMCEVYTDLMINLMEILFAEGGKPDGIWFCEDMGFKQKPFMSPQMYKEIIQPSHKRSIDFVHSQGMKVIMHTCGFIEPLLPGLIEAGLDCIQAMENKAGMDPLRIKQTYGDQLVLCGGIDTRTLETNDTATVQAELDAKLPGMMEGGGYILQTDHSVSTLVEYETYKYFNETGKQMGKY